MIPNKPRQFNAASQEGIMFEALEKLPEEYYVFHSLKISIVSNNTLYESETDFVIFHKEKGILCLEAKAGQVRYENGDWLYGNGLLMHNGGPFNQASANKWKLKNYIENRNLSSILNRCKFLHAVWFPSISLNALHGMNLPSESDKSLILTKEALENPEPYINKLFNIELPNKIQTKLSDIDIQRLIREIFCPQFNIFPSVSFESDLKKIVFHRLLSEQTGILNFLSDQKTAVINGAAGTGKTMIAIEKAQRHASAGEMVLFLCYNFQLKKYLEDNYSHEKIDYYTISGLACKLCLTSEPDYNKLKILLEDMYLAESFPYQHIIIDEGQDFGMDEIEESNIIEALKDIVVDSTRFEGSFYLFYDKLQLIQSRRIPKYITDADCKLTLYRNCRNTENIATTSLRLISERKPKLLEGSVKGIPAKLHFCETVEGELLRIDNIIDSLKNDGFKDIVILTLKTEDRSILSNKTKEGLYRNKYRFTTCRKFKGLEADAIILIDLDGESFNSKNILLYYVGASRARLILEVVSILSDDDCMDILTNILNLKGNIKRPQKELASALNSIGIL